MKKIFVFILSMVSISSLAQIAIGKSSVTNNTVSLEFANENRGLLLPWVVDENTVEQPENGTMVFDSESKKVKVKLVTGWKDLSVNATGTTIDPITQVDGLSIQDVEVLEQTEAKMSIGIPTESKGILVLEDVDKAMILPKVNQPHLNIVNPAPGMMVYDTENNLLCVFNGKDWAFWKAEE